MLFFEYIEATYNCSENKCFYFNLFYFSIFHALLLYHCYFILFIIYLFSFIDILYFLFFFALNELWNCHLWFLFLCLASSYLFIYLILFFRWSSPRYWLKRVEFNYCSPLWTRQGSEMLWITVTGKRDFFIFCMSSGSLLILVFNKWRMAGLFILHLHVVDSEMLVVCLVAGSPSSITSTVSLRITSTQSHASIDARCPTAECTAVCTSSPPLVMGRHSFSSIKCTQTLCIFGLYFWCGEAFRGEL